jgi:hypothetical protein
MTLTRIPKRVSDDVNADANIRAFCEFRIYLTRESDPGGKRPSNSSLDTNRCVTSGINPCICSVPGSSGLSRSGHPAVVSSDHATFSLLCSSAY